MNSLAQNFNTKKVLRFSFPSIVMMVFLSLYTIVDGMFISAYINTTALGAVNIVFPVIAIFLGISIMIASGGSAIIATKLGENKKNEASSNFTFFIIVEVAIALVFVIFLNIFLDPLIKALGATEAQLPYCRQYLRIMVSFCPLYFLQSAFQVFFVTAGKPSIGLLVTISAGITNIVLDWFFMAILKMGMSGAALASVLGQLVSALSGILYFSFKRNLLIRLMRFRFSFSLLVKSCFNGSSEMVTNLASAITTFLFNYQCLKFYGDSGVAAITVVLYFQFLINAVIFGFSSGIAPVISYKMGNNDLDQVKKIFKISMIFIIVFSVLSFIGSLLLIRPVAHLFAGDNKEVYSIIVEDFIFFAPSFIFMGVSIFASSFFTALENGKLSAIISFLRTLLLLSASIMILPLIFDKTGIWISVSVAEIIGFIVSSIILITNKSRYKY